MGESIGGFGIRDLYASYKKLDINNNSKLESEELFSRTNQKIDNALKEYLIKLVGKDNLSQIVKSIKILNDFLKISPNDGLNTVQKKIAGLETKEFKTYLEDYVTKNDSKSELNAWDVELMNEILEPQGYKLVKNTGDTYKEEEGLSTKKPKEVTTRIYEVDKNAPKVTYYTIDPIKNKTK